MNKSLRVGLATEFLLLFSRDRGGLASGVGQHARAGSPRAILLPWNSFACCNGCGHDCVYCLHGASPEENSGPISQTPSGDAANDLGNTKSFAS